MPERVDELFGEYAEAYARGERPLAGEFVARAGSGGDELARLIDSFLTRAPAPAPDAVTVELFEAWQAGESPLLRLRTARGLKREAVVAALVKTLRLDPKKERKVGRYYDELEAGVLRPARVDLRVWEVLAAVLGVRVADLLAWRPRPIQFQPRAFSQAPMAMASIELSATTRGQEDVEDDEDEVDRLFLSR